MSKKSDPFPTFITLDYASTRRSVAFIVQVLDLIAFEACYKLEVFEEFGDFVHGKATY
jgi:hypothetical protein